jgi:hypothetical protein
MAEFKWLKKPPAFQFFTDSPDTGWPECVCSICNQMIQEDEMPLRLWPQSNPNIEARLCEKCQTEYLGIEHFKDVEEDDDGTI